MPNYNNMYGYPYGNVYQPYGVNNGYQNNYNQPQQYQQSQMQQTPQPQTSYLPLTFTSGLVGAKAFIVSPNQTVFLKDSDEGSNLLFEKSADAYGKYTLKAYNLTEVKLDDIGKPVSFPKNNDSITKNDLQSFATKNDLNDLKTIFETKMNDLSTLIQKGSKTAKSSQQIKDSE